MDKHTLICTGLALWQEEGRTINLPVSGTSMAPLILPGDGICVRLMPPEKIRPGEVIAFVQDSHIVVHRLINKKKMSGRRMFYQKGINLQGGCWVEQNKILGRVESIKRQGRIMGLTGPYFQKFSRFIVFKERCLMRIYETISPFLDDHVIRAAHRFRSRRIGVMHYFIRYRITQKFLEGK